LRRRRGYYYIATAIGLFVLFLMLAAISPPDGMRVFAVLGFASLILGMRKGLKLWNLDELVFDPTALRPVAPQAPADTPRREPREPVRRRFMAGSRHVRPRVDATS